jgi:hypothetical protein
MVALLLDRYVGLLRALASEYRGSSLPQRPQISVSLGSNRFAQSVGMGNIVNGRQE